MTFLWKVAVLNWPRDLLYARINRRVRQMMDRGLEGEVRALLASGVPRESQSMQAIGYKEMIRFLDGACTREEAMEEIRKATRHYAKRQLTFLRREPRAVWLDARAENLAEAAEQVFCGQEALIPEKKSITAEDMQRE